MIGGRPLGHEVGSGTLPQDGHRGEGHPRPTQPADELLLAAYADMNTDTDTARAFVRRFQQTVYGVALAIAGPSQAEDIAQEAFERAWHYAASYDPRRGSVRSWLVRIVHNVAIDALRAGRSTPVAPHVLIDLIDRITRVPPEIAADTSELIRDALAALPPEQSRAVLLAAVQGHTAREIADLENVPLGTAKDRIRTGLHKLHATLSPAGDDRA